ncbi:hypothetical protein HYN49_13565 [Flavobacterium pallidum]|uniref:Histidine kinase n=1 Tax=Flavobacterium pallidum TaxID=2172098 RepID=A0A2S1SK96_9FLAO|nr:hypothetical protein HYN49_13565 [Flavobacterium pallidum]
MKFKKAKSIGEVSDREMLNFIFANQLYILRTLDFVERSLTNSDVPEYPETVKQMVNNIDSSLSNINEYLQLSDYDKGELNL